MPNPENTEQENSTATLPPIVVLLDDDASLAKKWQACFTIPGIEALRPQTTEWLDEDTVDEINLGITVFLQAFTDSLLARVAVVVADQCLDNPDLGKAIEDFLLRVKAQNPNAWILEVSQAPGQLMYPNSNAFLSQVPDGEYAQQLIKKSSDIPGVRLAAIKQYSNAYLVRASMADPAQNIANNAFDRDSVRERGFDTLQMGAYWHLLEEKLNLGEWFPYGNIFRKLSAFDQRLFLHYAWTIVGHVREGHELKYYEMSLANLKKLLLENKPAD